MIGTLLKRISELEPAPPWSLFAAINTVLMAIIAVIAASLLVLSLLNNQEYGTLAAWILAGGLTAVFVRTTRRAPEHWQALRLGPTRSRLLIVFLFSLGMAITIDLAGLAISDEFLPPVELQPFIREPIGIVTWVLLLVFMLVVQPVAEEMVFRGVFYPSSRHVLGAWGGLLASAGVYALFHFFAYSSPVSSFWHALLAPFLAGLVISIARANSGSTRAAIAAHVGFNIFAVLQLLLLTF